MQLNEIALFSSIESYYRAHTDQQHHPSSNNHHALSTYCTCIIARRPLRRDDAVPMFRSEFQKDKAKHVTVKLR